MAKKKFYAIKKGEHPVTKEVVENLLFETWDEAKGYVQGVKGAEYKSFPTKEQAENFLSTSDPLLNKSEQAYNPTALHCYVDGSFNEEIPNYSYGLVCVKDGIVKHLDKGAGNNPEAIEMRQIGGELLGAMKSVLWAKKQGYSEVVIFHDYKGVCYHATGYWKRDNPFSETYYQWMQKFMKENPQIQISFCKVDAHTGDDFNELADGLAKEGCGLKPNPIYFKTLTRLGLQAS